MIKKIRCDSCGSTKTRVRIKTNERVCEHCGSIVSINKIVEDNYAG